MKSNLPSTPLDALKISLLLRSIVKIIHFFADLFGFWKYPLTKMSADFESWSLMEKIYWGYKSKRPVKFPEKKIPSKIFKTQRNSSFPIPTGFKKTQTITLSAVGDLIKTQGLENSKDSIYSQVGELIFNTDISYANLESQLTSENTGGYTFSDKETPPLCCTKAQYDTLTSFQGKRFTLLHTACNHTLDMGPEGLNTTLAQLESDHIIDLGTNRALHEQNKGRIIERNGLRFGFISATFGLNGKKIPQGSEYLVNVVKLHNIEPGKNLPDISLLEEQLSYLKKEGCHIIIASLHWGYEYEFFPRLHQIELAHWLVENGVDVILGHHSHVIQPVEFYTPSSNPNRKAVIAYSLGNLTSSFSAPHIILSNILNISFALCKSLSSDEEKAFIEECIITPVIQMDFIENQLPVIRIEKLESLRQSTTVQKNWLTSIKKYARLIFNDENV